MARMTYRRAGVNISAAERLVERIRPIALKTARPGLLAGVGGFSALFDLKSRNYRHPVLVSSTDGVGTKLKIAFMMNVHDTVGIDLVAMGVNDILTQGAEPLFFLDYFATGRLKPRTALQVIRGIAAGCRLAGCALIGGETAEMPSFYGDGEYDLAGFAVGVVEKKKIPDPAVIVPGDLLVGLPSSGLHSNGYSLARRVLLDVRGLKLGDRISELGRTLGEEMLEPTRIYAGAIQRLVRRYAIKGIAHITGGGIPGNLPRIFPRGRRGWIRRGGWPVPPIFDLIQRFGGVSQAEMDRTFNNGLGIILVIGKREADRVGRALKKMGEKWYLIGEVRKGERGVAFVS
ncbi:MAG: phosphoribosylformylglycinamidine cyclo-ligase [Deltaproteobacteria bacterium RIFCSPHIGHO2_02_FULL_60_17]|nr:MAG: phosphoribosylformylglycinamidine cyclo-ligase [Deltaproteobacteria bacterium RIFCSPHIGHO2_02_FULL_60_17]